MNPLFYATTTFVVLFLLGFCFFKCFNFLLMYYSALCSHFLRFSSLFAFFLFLSHILLFSSLSAAPNLPFCISLSITHSSLSISPSPASSSLPCSLFFYHHLSPSLFAIPTNSSFHLT